MTTYHRSSALAAHVLILACRRLYMDESAADVASRVRMSTSALSRYAAGQSSWSMDKGARAAELAGIRGAEWWRAIATAEDVFRSCQNLRASAAAGEATIGALDLRDRRHVKMVAIGCGTCGGTGHVELRETPGIVDNDWCPTCGGTGTDVRAARES